MQKLISYGKALSVIVRAQGPDGVRLTDAQSLDKYLYCSDPRTPSWWPTEQEWMEQREQDLQAMREGKRPEEVKVPDFVFDADPTRCRLPPPELKIYRDARSKFWEAMRNGEIETHGCRRIVGGLEPRTRIEPCDLERADIAIYGDLRCDRRSGGAELYANPCFGEDDVRRVARAAAGDAEKATTDAPEQVKPDVLADDRLATTDAVISKLPKGRKTRCIHKMCAIRWPAGSIPNSDELPNKQFADEVQDLLKAAQARGEYAKLTISDKHVIRYRIDRFAGRY